MFILVLLTWALAACQQEEPVDSETPDPQVQEGEATTPSLATSAAPSAVPATSDAASEDAYPGPATPEESSPGYPGPDPEQEELLPEPPDPDVELPAPEGETSTLGGVLVQRVGEEGFLPFSPHELILAEMVYTTDGEPAFISYDEGSPRAETFDTGIFIFRQVPPGTYGLIANLAVTEFALKNEAQEEILITVEPGEVVDLGRIMVDLP